MRDYARMLAVDAGAPPRTLTFGPGDIIDFIKRKLPQATDIVGDAANYIARNGVRTGMQNVLHEALAEAGAQDGATPVVLAGHSQGTIVSYDVLRQAGKNYPGVLTRVTMGCPLKKYLGFPLEWGGRAVRRSSEHPVAEPVRHEGHRRERVERRRRLGETEGGGQAGRQRAKRRRQP